LDPDKIYELRMMKGLTQEEVAKKAGRTKASISLYESGQRLTPNPDTTRKLAKALGVGVPDILIREEVDEDVS
jgi:transcriptional regulator with XRE-family HTH domain